MDNRFIAVMDSGIGGISVLNDLIKVLPNERFLYFSDSLNVPYGNKSKRELLNLTLRNIEYVKSFGVKAIVLACNTLSLSVLGDIRICIRMPIFGVFPPVESSLLAGEKAVLFATNLTAKYYSKIKGLRVVGLGNLANEIELHKFDFGNYKFLDCILKDINFAEKRLTLKDFDTKNNHYFDTIILGCTHYVFVENEIIDHFQPQKIISGNHFSVKMVKNFFQTHKTLVNYKGFDLLFVGDSAKMNRLFFEKCGQESSNLAKKIQKN